MTKLNYDFIYKSVLGEVFQELEPSDKELSEQKEYKEVKKRVGMVTNFVRSAIEGNGTYISDQLTGMIAFDGALDGDDPDDFLDSNFDIKAYIEGVVSGYLMNYKFNDLSLQTAEYVNDMIIDSVKEDIYLKFKTWQIEEEDAYQESWDEYQENNYDIVNLADNE